MNSEGYKDPTAEMAIRMIEQEERRAVMDNGNFGRCRSCGQQVLWIRTKAGKNMPCNTQIIEYREPKEGEKRDELLVTPDGDTVSAVIEKGTGNFGYISHFATCPNASSFRGRKARN